MLGKPVADLSLPSTGGSTFKLSPGCTQQGSDFHDARDALRKASVDAYGISLDSLKSHVMKLENMCGRKVRGIGRSTFAIDEKRTVVRAWRGVKLPGHVQEVLNFVKAL